MTVQRHTFDPTRFVEMLGDGLFFSAIEEIHVSGRDLDLGGQARHDLVKLTRAWLDAPTSLPTWNVDKVIEAVRIAEENAEYIGGPVGDLWLRVAQVLEANRAYAARLTAEVETATRALGARTQEEGSIA